MKEQTIVSSYRKFSLEEGKDIIVQENISSIAPIFFQLTLLLLHFKNSFFNSILHNEAVHIRGLCLANSIDSAQLLIIYPECGKPIHCLLFHCWVGGRLHQEAMLCTSERKTSIPLHGDKEDSDIWTGLEGFNGFCALLFVGCFESKICWRIECTWHSHRGDAALVQSFFNQI